jgi:hypothetical protein
MAAPAVLDAAAVHPAHTRALRLVADQSRPHRRYAPRATGTAGRLRDGTCIPYEERARGGERCLRSKKSEAGRREGCVCACACACARACVLLVVFAAVCTVVYVPWFWLGAVRAAARCARACGVLRRLRPPNKESAKAAPISARSIPMAAHQIDTVCGSDATSRAGRPSPLRHKGAP